MRQRMIKVEAKDGLDVEPIHRVWIEGYAKLGQKPFKQFYSSNSVGFLEFQKHRQLATLFWLYDNLGFEMLMKMSLAPSVVWTVSMLKIHNKDTIDFFLYDNTNDFIRINVALSGFFLLSSSKTFKTELRFSRTFPIFVNPKRRQRSCSIKSMSKSSILSCRSISQSLKKNPSLFTRCQSLWSSFCAIFL